MKIIHLSLITILVISVVGSGMAYAQITSNNNVEIQNIQVEPSEIKAGDTFKVNATLVNNSPDPLVFQYGICEGPFSVTFDNHVTVNQKQIMCPAMAMLEKIEPGGKTTFTSPGSEFDYQATSSGTANATAKFWYFVRNQTDPNSSSIATTISKSFLFTISGNNTATKIPIETILSPLEQIKSGIHPKDVACKSGYVLLMKSEDGSPACIRPSTAQKLVERGWGTIIKSSTPMSCPSGQTMVNGLSGVKCIIMNPAARCSPGYTVIQISFGSYLCQPTNPPSLSNPSTYAIGQKVGAFTISAINPYNVTGYYNSPYPIGRPGLGDFTIMHLGDTLNPTCDGSAPLVITAINYPNSITVSIGKSMGRPFGGCPICLSSDTVIDTPNGPINVKELKTGMQVWTQDNLGHKQIVTILKVGRTLVPPTHKMVHLILYDGRELFASPGHPTTDGRVLGELKAGDVLDSTKIKTFELVPYNENYTYDILPSGSTGFYWADGILLKSTLK